MNLEDILREANKPHKDTCCKFYSYDIPRARWKHRARVVVSDRCRSTSLQDGVWFYETVILFDY